MKKFSKGIGFEFHNFKPQPIFELVQETASDLDGTITDEEMFRTFNMGWGFAVIVDRAEKDKGHSHCIEGWPESSAELKIGQVTKFGWNQDPVQENENRAGIAPCFFADESA